MPQALEQLTATDVGTNVVIFETLQENFFRQLGDPEGRVWYALIRGLWTFRWPVMRDGTISRSGEQAQICPSDGVVVFTPEELISIGITETKFLDE